MGALVALMKEQITIEDMQFMSQHYFGKEHLVFNHQLIIGPQQLFESANGKYQLLFNGKIYNKEQLQCQLEKLGLSFETNEEAEVILALYQIIGLDFISQLRGMFSLILYDHTMQKIIAARDRFGIKPLYYFKQDDVLLLTSELRTFKFGSYQEADLDWQALGHYFTFQYVPEPMTPLKDVKLLEPGTYLTYQLQEGIKILRYQAVEQIPTHYHSNITKEQLKAVVMETVHEYLQGAKTVGCFLSSGLDSTIITACAKMLKPDLKAFTIGFKEKCSEIKEAAKTADQFGIDLVTKQISAAEFMRHMVEVIDFLDTPVADPSSIALYLIAKEAKKHTDIVLSGEGADELFGGYPIYQEVEALRGFAHLPLKVKNMLLELIKKIPDGIKGKGYIYRGCTPLGERYVGNAFVFNEAEKARLLKFCQEIDPFMRVTAPMYERISHLDNLSQMQTIDLLTWLRGDILTKTDRLSVAHGLELRLPFLDEKVFQIAKELTKEEKITKAGTKILLREAFYEMVPKHVYEGPKRGYPIPLAGWLRNELYDEAKAILTTPSCEHLINQQEALSYLEAHARGRKDYARKVWSIITFIKWYESWNIQTC